MRSALPVNFRLPAVGIIGRKVGRYYLFTALVLFLLTACGHQPPPSVKHTVQSDAIQKPTDVIYFKGKYVSTELERNQLAIFNDFRFQNVKHFNPKKIGKRFRAPHHLAISPWNTLLITNGWGKSVIEMADLKGTGWKAFNGPPQNKLNAPHGIAVDHDTGWIYVGDSLNSRIVRFKNMNGDGWQVFPDRDRKVSYTRQMIFKEGALWVSNSYEKREGLNPGKGANVLRIDDFETGEASEIYYTSRANITGIFPEKAYLIVALWADSQRLIAKHLKSGDVHEIEGSRISLGTPYGIFKDPHHDRLVVSYFGAFKGNRHGGFLILSQ